MRVTSYKILIDFSLVSLNVSNLRLAAGLRYLPEATVQTPNMKNADIRAIALILICAYDGGPRRISPAGPGQMSLSERIRREIPIDHVENESQHCEASEHI